MKLVIATGISGCGEKEFLAKWAAYSQARGKRVKVIDVGKLMFQHFKDLGHRMNLENILRVEQWRLQTDRSAVLKGILPEILDHADEYDAMVLSMHAWFRWDHVYLEAYDKFLRKFLTRPESTLFITFIDDYRPILQRLKSRPQWQDQELNAEEILSWQNIEVSTTYGLAGLFDIPFQTVATAQPPSEFYKLVFHPEIESIYVGMPISHLREAKDRESVDQFIGRLSKYFRVVNPLAVEVVGAIHFDKEEKDKYGAAVHNHIAHRDLYWFLHFCDKMIAYWPKVVPPEAVQAVAQQYPEIIKLWPKAISSPGLSSEMHSARGEGRDVWTVFLGSEASPFVVRNTTKLFLSEADFFNFLDKKYPERKNLVW